MARLRAWGNAGRFCLDMSKISDFITRNKSSILFTLGVIAISVAGLWLARCFWWWLHPQDTTASSNSDTLRNVGLLIGGAIAVLFGIWRAWVAGRQADGSQAQAAAAKAQVDAVQVQVEAAQRQAEIAQQSLLNQRYQRGAEMLASGNLTARLGGIYALQQLAEEYAEQYQVQILRLFCAFARDPDGDLERGVRRSVIPSQVLRHSLRLDVQACVEGISRILDTSTDAERELFLYVDLRGAILNGVRLEDGDLSGVDLSDAELVRADLENTNLWGAQLRRTRLQDSNLRGVDLSRATISSATLTDADLLGAKLDEAIIFGSDLGGVTFYEASLAGTVFSNTAITQSQLDQSEANPQNPPKFLSEPIDPSTDRPLNWFGEPLHG